MLDAIATMIGATVEIFLGINSGELRKKRFAKDIFGVYKALDDIDHSLEDIDRAVLAVNTAGAIDPAVPLSAQRHEASTALGDGIRSLTAALAELRRIMSAESWDLFQLQFQPEMLRAIGVFDRGVVETFTRAWFEDGGFVEALHRLGLRNEEGGRILRLLDAGFHPRTSPHGYNVEPEVSQFDLLKSKDVKDFRERLSACKGAVVTARESVRKFIAANFSVSDIA